jgi:branched-chain amino acid transport system permease protein
MSAAELLNLLVAALLLAGVYAAMSIGMTIVYGVMKIVNLAHAGFLMLGAYFVYELYERWQIDPLLGVLAALPVFFAAGWLVHLALLRRLPRSDRPALPSLLLLFGLWLVLQNVAYLIWGSADRAILTPRTLAVVHLGPLTLPVVRLAVFAAAVAAVAALELVLHRTWFGRAVRALMQNGDAARLAGVDVDATARLAFGAGVALAGAAGGLLAMLYSFSPDFGAAFLLRAFVVIVLGGLESFAGVAAGALVLALLESASLYVLPASYQPAVAFGALAVALVVLPGGISGAWRRWRGGAA